MRQRPPGTDTLREGWGLVPRLQVWDLRRELVCVVAAVIANPVKSASDRWSLFIVNIEKHSCSSALELRTIFLQFSRYKLAESL